MNGIYDFTMKSLSGKEINFAGYKDKVMLIANTASKCGFTPQYEGLENLYKKYKDKGLVVLGFPCNQFLGQEPGDAKEIQETCLINYGVTFQMFAKIDVNGENQAHLFAYLKEKAHFEGYPIKEVGEQLDNIHKEQKTGFEKGDNIRWNFTKFLVSKDGKTIKRFESMVKPEELEKDIEKMLAE